MMNEDFISYEDHQKKKLFDHMLKYCVYRERCHKEVAYKLRELGADDDMAGEIIAELISERALNEERYARSYARGKFRIKKWGRRKIKIELAKNNIPAHLIELAMEEIDEEEYLSELKKLLSDKAEKIKAGNNFEKNRKLMTYAYSRGYESELIRAMIEEI